MDRQSTTYTFIFALIVCVVCSFTLSLVSEGLRPKKELNEAVDVKKNILKAVGITTEKGTMPAEIEELFEQKIQAIVVDDQGNVVDNKLPEDIMDGDALYPVYVYSAGRLGSVYCIPIIGKGLWSTLYGYLAISRDAKTVEGITFYKHGETPGLGAEIEKPWFQDNFKGKRIWDDQGNRLIPVAVLKGKVDDLIQDEAKKQHYVDGISGATMTANGVTEMLDKWLNVYEPYFSKIRQR